MKPIETIRSGVGLYDIREAAYYARTQPQRLRYWVLGTKKNPPLRSPRVDPNGHVFVTFHELLEAIAVRNLRSFFGGTISLQLVRKAIQRAQDKYGVEIPFADYRHKIATDGKDILIYFNDEENPTQVTGAQKKGEGQIRLQKVETKYLKYVFANPRTHLAEEYIIGRYNDRDIVLNPERMFGEPVAKGAPCSAPALWRAVRAENLNYAAVARDYSVNIDAVIASYQFCEDIGYAA